MKNSDIAIKVKEDLENYGLLWRSAPIFEIRRIMAKKNIKNIDIAERLGVSEQNVSRLLRGDQNIKIETLYLLAGAVEEKIVLDIAPRERPCLVPSFQQRPELQSFEDVAYVGDKDQWTHFSGTEQLRYAAGNDDIFHSEMTTDEVFAAFS